MKRFIITSFLIIGSLVAYEVSEGDITLSREKLHEQWWQSALGSTVSYNLFAEWLGNEGAPSRQAVYTYLKERNYRSLLDVPCGLCIDFFGLRKAHVEIIYQGLDITPKLVERAHKQGIAVTQGSIEAIPFEKNQFEVAYARHILEHLDYYEKALDELMRVASREVLVVFFIKPPHGKEDIIDLAILDGAHVYHNRYNREKLERYIMHHEKVAYYVWQDVNGNEDILHIYLRDQ